MSRLGSEASRFKVDLLPALTEPCTVETPTYGSDTMGGRVEGSPVTFDTMCLIEPGRGGFEALDAGVIRQRVTFVVHLPAEVTLSVDSRLVIGGNRYGVVADQAPATHSPLRRALVVRQP